MNKKDEQLELYGLPAQYRKHSALVAMHCDLTLNQRKAFDGLLALAAEEMRRDEQKLEGLPIEEALKIASKPKRFSVSLERFEALTNINTHNKKRLIRELEELMDVKAKWNVLGKDKTEDYTEATVLLADFTLRNKIISFGFSPLIQERVLKPRLFAPLDFKTIRTIERKYSLILYGICKDYRNIYRLELSIEELRKLFGIFPSEYVRDKALDDKVVAPAVAELNEKSELTVAYRYSYVGRRISNIVINIKEKDAAFSKKTGTIAKDMNELISLLPEELRGNRKILAMAKEKYVTEGYDYVRTNIEFTLKKAKSNPSRLLLMALEDDYAYAERAKKIATEKKRKEKKAGKSTIIAEESSYEKEMKDKVIAEKTDIKNYIKYFKSLSNKQQHAILEEIDELKERSDFLFVLYGTKERRITIFLRDIKGVVL